jgi:hypothetical protein
VVHIEVQVPGPTRVVEVEVEVWRSGCKKEEDFSTVEAAAKTYNITCPM